jgi:hypothetical protein
MTSLKKDKTPFKPSTKIKKELSAYQQELVKDAFDLFDMNGKGT